jgi:hypothetical protein
MPCAIAEAVCSEEYRGQELSDKIRSERDVARTEAARQRMTQANRDEFSDLCEKRCRAAYEVNAGWFMKCVRSRSNRGRDQLYVYIRHWMAAYLHDAEAFRKQFCGVEMKAA